MAKRNKSTMKLDEVNGESKQNGKIKVFLYLFIIPFLFALALLLIVTQIADINVFEKAKELTQWNREEALTNEDQNTKLEEKVVNLQAEIQEKEAEIDQLQTEIDESAKTSEALLIEQERLLDEIDTLQREQKSTKREYGEIVSTFENMSAKTSAPVIVKMSDAEALRILTSLKPETVAEIFEKMLPEDAAKYTELMSKQ